MWNWKYPQEEPSKKIVFIPICFEVGTNIIYFLLPGTYLNGLSSAKCFPSRVPSGLALYSDLEGSIPFS